MSLSSSAFCADIGRTFLYSPQAKNDHARVARTRLSCLCSAGRAAAQTRSARHRAARRRAAGRIRSARKLNGILQHRHKLQQRRGTIEKECLNRKTDSCSGSPRSASTKRHQVTIRFFKKSQAFLQKTSFERKLHSAAGFAKLTPEIVRRCRRAPRCTQWPTHLTGFMASTCGGAGLSGARANTARSIHPRRAATAYRTCTTVGYHKTGQTTFGNRAFSQALPTSVIKEMDKAALRLLSP